MLPKSDKLYTDIHAITYLFEVINHFEEVTGGSTSRSSDRVSEYLKSDVPFIAFTCDNAIELYKTLRFALVSVHSYTMGSSYFSRSSYDLSKYYNRPWNERPMLSDVIFDPELFHTAGLFVPMLYELNRRPHLRHFLQEGSFRLDELGDLVRRMNDPAYYYHGVSRGFLTVLSGPSKEDASLDSDVNCICRSCGSNVDMSMRQLVSSIACPSCQASFGITEPWTMEQAQQHALKHLNSRLIDIERNARISARIEVPAEALKRNSDLVDRFGLYPALGRLRADQTVRNMSKRWKFTDAAELLQYAGFPLTQTDELHRKGHEHDANPFETPYSIQNSMWLPKRINCMKKCTNKLIQFQGMTFDNAKAACKFAGLSYDALLARRRRAKEAGTPLSHQDAFDQLCATAETDSRFSAPFASAS